MVIKNVVKLVLTVGVCGLIGLPVCCNAAKHKSTGRKRTPQSCATVNKDAAAAAAVKVDSKSESVSEPERDDSENEETPEPQSKRPRKETDEDNSGDDEKSDLERESDLETEPGEEFAAVCVSAPAGGSEAKPGEEFAAICAAEYELCASAPAGDPHRPLNFREYALMEALTKVNGSLRLHRGCQRLQGKYAVVGDIHGDLATFNAVISKLQTDIDSEKIQGVVFLGDLWDRGTGGREIFESLIRFMATNNKGQNLDKVVVLRGNHETVSYLVSNAATEDCAQRILGYFGLEPCDFFALRRLLLRPDQFSQCAEYIDSLPEPLRNKVVEFYQLLPFNVIINDDTYLAHGGVPLWSDKSNPNFKVDSQGIPCEPITVNILPKLAKEIISTEAGVYPREVLVTEDVFNAVYSSVWSDFVENRGDGNWCFSFSRNYGRGSVKGESCQFGVGALSAYSYQFHCDDTSLNIRHYVFGHDHRKGEFAQACFFPDGRPENRHTCTTVISSPWVTSTPDGMPLNEGSVALLVPEQMPRKYIKIEGTQVSYV